MIKSVPSDWHKRNCSIGSFTYREDDKLADMGLFPQRTEWKGADCNFVFSILTYLVKKRFKDILINAKETTCSCFSFEIRLCYVLTLRGYEDQVVTVHANWSKTPAEKDSVSSGVKTARVNYVLTAGMRQPTDYYKVFINCDGW